MNDFYTLIDFISRVLYPLLFCFYSVFLGLSFNKRKFYDNISLCNPFKKRSVGGKLVESLSKKCLFGFFKNLKVMSFAFWPPELMRNLIPFTFLGKLLFSPLWKILEWFSPLLKISPRCGLFDSHSHSFCLASDGSFQVEGLCISFAWVHFLCNLFL